MPIQPIDYTTPQQNVTGSFAQGLQIGQSIQAQNLARQKAQQARDLKAQYSIDLQETLKNPTPQAMASLTLKYPGQKDAFKQGFDILNAEQQKNEILQTGQVYSALLNGKTDIARDILTETITANENAGRDTSKLSNILNYIDRDPTGAAGYTGLVLSSVMDPKEFAKTFETLGKEAREEKKLPGEIKKQTAELKKYASGLGLSDAKKNKILAENRKLDVETQKLLLELESKKDAKGLITDPKDLFKAEQALRKEYSSEIADFTKTTDAFEKINAAEDTAVGDLSLIFSFMKMLDPGSVVREGEFATAQNAAGVDQKIINLYNNIATGERLNEKQRASFRSQANSLLKASEKKEKSTKDTLLKTVKSFGMSEANIFGEQAEDVTVEETPTTKVTTRSYYQKYGAK